MFKVILILGSIWVVLDKDSSKGQKVLSTIAIILIVIASAIKYLK